MSIKQINEDTVEQLCDNCEATREIALSKLTLGVTSEDYVSPTTICLPMCDECPTIEYLFVSEEVLTEAASEEDEQDGETTITEEAEQTGKSAHQLLVDQLGRRLIDIISQ